MARQTVARRQRLGIWRSNSPLGCSSAILGALQLVGSVGWHLQTGLKAQCKPLMGLEATLPGL